MTVCQGDGGVDTVTFNCKLTFTYIRVYTRVVGKNKVNLEEVTAMKTKLANWGNSAAIRIPKTILKKLKIDSNNFENISFYLDIEGEK